MSARLHNTASGLPPSRYGARREAHTAGNDVPLVTVLFLGIVGTAVVVVLVCLVVAAVCIVTA